MDAPLTAEEFFILHWLAKEVSSAYGECCGKSLDTLIKRGFAKTGPPGDPAPYHRVSLTEAGFAEVKRTESQ